MSRQFKYIDSAPVAYVDLHGEIKKRTLVPINGVHIPNSFNIPYVRGIVGLFNAMISRFMYYANYDEKHQERRYPKAQDHIYLPAHQISDMINRCESQCYNINDSLERIFDLDISRANEKFGANVFRLSERVDEFLFIFTPEQLEAFIQKYNISQIDQYALRQLYNYRVVRPSDKNMTREQKEDFHNFIKQRKHRNFTHFCSTNNKSIEARVIEIELHIDLLSQRQREQLNNIKQFLKEGITKLANYFHWKLLDIQQYISLMLKKDKVKASKSNQQEDNTPSLGVNRNKTQGEMQKTHDVAATHLKDPEDAPHQVVVQIATYWNIMARDRDMEFLYSLTDKKIKSIETLVKYHGKEKVLNTIKNTGNIILNNTLKFKDFIMNSNDPDSRFNKIHRRTNFDTRIEVSDEVMIRNKNYKFLLNHDAVSHDNIPTFKTAAEAKSWFKSHTNQM